MIIVRLMGGLGNQLFQYAAGRRLAEIHQTTLKYDLTFLLDRTPKKNFTFRDFDLPIFNITVNVASDSEINAYYNTINRAKRKFLPTYPNPYFKERFFHFDPSVLQLPDNCYLDGHWTSDKYFIDIEQLIRKELTFKNQLDERGELLSKKIQNCNSICLNVRRGDYVTNADINSKIGLTNLDYFFNAVELINKKTKAPEIFIFSDDIEWCAENLKFNLPTHIVDHSYKGHKFEQYLKLMTQCKHFIIPNSTFAWWGAWLSSYKDKVVITPKKWFNDSTLDDKDLRPQDWISL